MSPWLCIGLLLALVLTGSDATADARTGVDARAAHGSVSSRDDGSDLRGVGPEQFVTYEVAPTELETDDSFEATAATPAPVLVPYSAHSELPLDAIGVSPGRRLIVTGLGRGPPC